METKKTIWVVLVLMILAGLTLGGCGGKSAPTAEIKTNSISGTVTGKTGVVEGAIVQLSSINGEDCAAANDKPIMDINNAQTQEDIDLLKQCRDQFGDRMETDAKGFYKFENVPPGQYAIWIHWEQREIPSVNLATIPSTGFFFTTLWSGKDGSARVDVGMHEESLGLYEIDVHIPTFSFDAEDPLKVNFKW